MLRVSQLFIYPIKSLGGISLSSTTVTDRGFQYDRQWMLVDTNNRFLSQREIPAMALLQVALEAGHLRIYHKQNIHLAISVPINSPSSEKVTVTIWDEKCIAQCVSNEADAWFSKMLSFSCRLVYLPDDSYVYVDKEYASNNEITSLSDGYPFLMAGQSSLDDLNARLAEPLPINRFRPNIVFVGGEPYEEDFLAHFIINGVNFYGVKLCGRCVITSINQDNFTKSKEPLKTLATYRMRNNKIYFGQNLLHKGRGIINVGDKIEVVQKSMINQLTPNSNTLNV
jgi:uncharacterized protein